MPEFGLPYDYEDGLPTTIIDSHPNRPNEGYHSDSSNSSIDLSFASNLAIPISQRSGSSAGGGGRKYKYRTVGRSSGKMKGKGRVRGMVESWERSGSESEGGGGTSGDLRSAETVTQEASQPQLLREEEEPAMETLLSQSDARAWDENHGVRGAGRGKKGLETAKRSHLNGQENSYGSVRRVAGWEDTDDTPPPMMVTMKHLPSLPDTGSVRSNGNSSTGRERESGRGRGKRVVSAIFGVEPEVIDGSEGAAAVDGSVIMPTIGMVGETSEAKAPESEAEAVVSAQRDDRTQLEVVEQSQAGPVQNDRDLDAQAQAEEERKDENPHGLGQQQALEQRELELEREKELGLETELTRTKWLLAIFKKRLEEVERKVDDMHVQLGRDAKLRETETKNDRTRLDSVGSGTLTPISASASTGKEVVKRAFAFLYPASSSSSPSPPSTSSSPDVTEPAEPTTQDRKRLADPPISALPSYVLLVSIGMCAVVLRVVLGRVVRG
jgi:hypothetical protein